MKYKKNLVSIVMCEHNTNIEQLKLSIESMLNQTYSDFELIFVDDCSQTDYLSLNLFNDKRIRIIKNTKNLGLAASRNVGIDNSKGEFIAIMDTDDYSHPTRLEKQVSFLKEHEDVAACGTWFNMFGDRTGTRKREIHDNDYYRCCLLFKNWPTIINPSVMIRKSVLIDNSIRLNEKLYTAEDYGLWVELSRYGRITNVEEVLFDYRIREGQMSQVYKSRDMDDAHWTIFRSQLEKVGVDISKYDESFLRLDYKRKEIDGFKYYLFLKDICSSNLVTNFFDQDKLLKRVREQWVSKIYSIKNVFLLLRLFFQLPRKEKAFMIKSEFKRLFFKR